MIVGIEMIEQHNKAFWFYENKTNFSSRPTASYVAIFIFRVTLELAMVRKKPKAHTKNDIHRPFSIQTKFHRQCN